MWDFPRGPDVMPKTGHAPTKAASPSFRCTTVVTPVSFTRTSRFRDSEARKSASRPHPPAAFRLAGEVVEQSHGVAPAGHLKKHPKPAIIHPSINTAVKLVWCRDRFPFKVSP